MNIDATAEITTFDLPPIPRFLCAYVGDEWFIVARGRRAIGIELNPTYAEMARKRITDELGLLVGAA